MPHETHQLTHRPLQSRSTYHSDARAERVWGQVRAELAFYDTVVAVREGNTAKTRRATLNRGALQENEEDVPPDHTDLRALDLPLRTVDVRNPLQNKRLAVCWIETRQTRTLPR